MSNHRIGKLQQVAMVPDSFTKKFLRVEGRMDRIHLAKVLGLASHRIHLPYEVTKSLSKLKPRKIRSKK